MYAGFKVNTSINKSTVSGLNQTQIQTLQRQVDTYTRKLEVEKRKYFAIQDQHKSVTQQYTKQKEKLNKLKKENTKAESIILQAKIKNLQSTLDKTVSTYDDTIACNNRLKGEIDMLRRQKRNYLQMQKTLEDQAKKIDEQTNQKLALLNKKKQKAEDLKQQMIHTKNKNQQQRQSYLNQFSSLQKQYLYDQNSGDISSSKLKNSDLLSPSTNIKTEIVDTQPLLKFRLKRIIASNKEKLKLIEQYKKHMVLIQDAFNEIKQKSNIHDLDEITNTFIKSEEQNYSLYNYMDSLTQGIDRLEQENRELQENIRLKLIQDQQKKQGILNKMNTKQGNEDSLISHIKSKEDLILEQQIRKKEKQTQSLVSLIQKIKPTLQSTLIQLADSPISNPVSNLQRSIKRSQQYKLSLNISDRNIEQYLSELQKHINMLLITKQQAQTRTISQMKDTVTIYSKPIPSVNYEEMIKDKEKNEKVEKGDENKFLEQNKFRQYAIQFWQKRKTNAKQLGNQPTTNNQSLLNSKQQISQSAFNSNINNANNINNNINGANSPNRETGNNNSSSSGVNSVYVSSSNNNNNSTSINNRDEE